MRKSVLSRGKRVCFEGQKWEKVWYDERIKGGICGWIWRRKEIVVECEVVIKGRVQSMLGFMKDLGCFFKSNGKGRNDVIKIVFGEVILFDILKGDQKGVRWEVGR